MNKSGTRWRGKIPIPKHTHPLVRRLIQEANDQGTTLTEISTKAGLRRETISEWRYRRMPKIDNFVAVANALGLDLCFRERE